MLNTLIWIIISILLIGFFAGIEIAFVSVNRLTVELKKKQGKTGGLIISEFMAAPSTFISTTLIGFNLFLVVYGLLVGEILSPVWNWLLIKLQIPGAYVNMARLFVETFAAAFIVLLLGEFIPKAFWRAKNEWLLSPLISRMVSMFSWMFSNIASFFIAIAEWILKYLFNVRLDERRDPFTRADLENIFQPVNEQGEELQELNTELFENALSLPNIKIRQCLIPRKEIIGIELNTPVEEARKKF
ncbi:MAG TPA: CNNM domain-containing protein, partial [Chitinophagaceae bacterium]|nr:CNNM domain-containing protein [Chitinophagaceae bacterium]